MNYQTVNLTSLYADCRTENAFKNKWIKRNKHFWKKMWCIETEETVPGFPDVLAVDGNGKVHLIEFKVSDKRGVIRFQPTQPAFYKMNMDIPIHVVALTRKKGSCEGWVHFKSSYLVEGNLIRERGEVLIASVLDYILMNELYVENESWEEE